MLVNIDHISWPGRSAVEVQMSDTVTQIGDYDRYLAMRDETANGDIDIAELQESHQLLEQSCIN